MALICSVYDAPAANPSNWKSPKALVVTDWELAPAMVSLTVAPGISLPVDLEITDPARKVWGKPI